MVKDRERERQTEIKRDRDSAKKPNFKSPTPTSTAFMRLVDDGVFQRLFTRSKIRQKYLKYGAKLTIFAASCRKSIKKANI